jgi:hypothetical protein
VVRHRPAQPDRNGGNGLSERAAPWPQVDNSEEVFLLLVAIARKD